MIQDLTKREIEVLKLVATNCSNTDIAEELMISVHTVKAHISSIIEKLDANGRTHTAVKAIKLNIIDYDEVEKMAIEKRITR